MDDMSVGALVSERREIISRFIAILMELKMNNQEAAKYLSIHANIPEFLTLEEWTRLETEDPVAFEGYNPHPLYINLPQNLVDTRAKAKDSDEFKYLVDSMNKVVDALRANLAAINPPEVKEGRPLESAAKEKEEEDLAAINPPEVKEGRPLESAATEKEEEDLAAINPPEVKEGRPLESAATEKEEEGRPGKKARY